MAATYKSTQLTNIDAGTHQAAAAYQVGSRERPIFRGTLAFGTTVMAKSEDVEMVRLPIGVIPFMCWILVSESLGSAKMAIGITGATGKYMAAATFTTADRWVPFMLESAFDDGALTAIESILVTNDTTAAFPTTTGGSINMAFECLVP